MAVCRLCSGTEDSGVLRVQIYVELGGLASYGPDISAYFRRGTEYVDKILEGEKPGDFPVELPTAAPLALASPLPEIAISIPR
jgi:putative ABC transport system substrate-binding protein